MVRRTPLLALLFIASTGLVQGLAAETSTIMPRVGETTEEFEARRRGVTRTRSDGDAITIPADPKGHYFVQPHLDGQPVHMIVDTGASVVALTYEDAERMGVPLSPRAFTIKMATANGNVDGAPIRIREIRIKNVVVQDVEAVVLPKGRLAISLLGMSFLKRLGGFDISRGRLSLRN